MAKSKLNDLLTELDEAIELTDSKYALLSSAQVESAQAVAKAQAVFDAVKADHAKRVGDAVTAHEAAKAQMEKLHKLFNERIGTLPNSRVSVR
jgi:hypothetical protein